jgi:TPR repeat protein
VSRGRDRTKSARTAVVVKGAALLLASACLCPAQAAPTVQPGFEAAAAASGMSLAQNPAGAEMPPKPVPRAKPAKKKPGPSKHGKKPAAVPKATAPALPSEAKVREYMHVPDAQIEARIAEQRQLLRYDPRDETAHQTLALIAVELGNRILDLDALGRKQDIARWIDVIRTKLADTFWRTSQLAKSDARTAAALGLFYSEGILTAPDAAKGCEEFARAAQGGHSAAEYQAALCLTRADPERARGLLERAAENDHAGAQELMGRACIEGEKKDRACAAKWLERAAAQGRPSAQSLLGWLYASDPAQSDAGKAVSYYRAAAQAGDHAAENNLGELYELGKGVPQDASLAFGWYTRAAQAGFPPAQLNLARLYAAGSGVARNTALAREWAERAQQQGQEHAGELLDWLAAQP